MIIYFTYFVIFFLLNNSIRKRELYYGVEYSRKRTAILVAIMLILLFGLRAYSVGIDTPSYYSDFKNIEYHLRFRQYEIGYYFFTYFLKDIGFSWQPYLMITGFMMIMPLSKLYYRKSPNFVLSMFLFMTIGNFTMYLSGMRQSLAISFCIVSMLPLDSLTNKKAVKIVASVLIWIVAIQFHVSAVVFILFFIIALIRPRINRITVYILLAFATLSLVYGKQVLPLLMRWSPEKYINFNLYSSYQINPLLIMVSVAIPAFAALYIATEKDGKFDVEVSRLFFCSILNVLFLCLSTNNNQIGRLMYYFSFSNTILIPLALNTIKGKDRLIISMSIVLLCLVYFFVATTGGTLKIDNYLFFWHN